MNHKDEKQCDAYSTLGIDKIMNQSTTIMRGAPKRLFQRRMRISNCA
jgi:hypothetical protein